MWECNTFIEALIGKVCEIQDRNSSQKPREGNSIIGSSLVLMTFVWDIGDEGLGFQSGIFLYSRSGVDNLLLLLAVPTQQLPPSLPPLPPHDQQVLQRE